MVKQIFYWSLGILATSLVAFLCFLIFIVKIGPVNLSQDESLVVTGIVHDLYEGGVKDLVFKLDKDSRTYYINRALENGFNLENITSELLGKEVTIWYSDSRSKTSFHMLQFKYQDSVYYTEWEIPLASKN